MGTGFYRPHGEGCTGIEQIAFAMRADTVLLRTTKFGLIADCEEGKFYGSAAPTHPRAEADLNSVM